MRHDWIFDVLEDLRSYAVMHGFAATAAKAEETLRAARLEVAEAEQGGGSAAGPPKGRPQ